MLLEGKESAGSTLPETSIAAVSAAVGWMGCMTQGPVGEFDKDSKFAQLLVLDSN